MRYSSVKKKDCTLKMRIVLIFYFRTLTYRWLCEKTIRPMVYEAARAWRLDSISLVTFICLHVLANVAHIVDVTLPLCIIELTFLLFPVVSFV